MKSILFCAAAALLLQGAAQAQYIPPGQNPYVPYSILLPRANQDGVINLTNPYNIITGQQILPQDGVTLLTVAPAGILNTRVSLELDNVSLRDAVTKLFDQVKENCTVELDKEASKEVRITLRVKNIKLSTALNAITEQANLVWNPSMRWPGGNGTAKTVFHLSPAPKEEKEAGTSVLYDNSGNNLFLPYPYYWGFNNHFWYDNTFNTPWDANPYRWNLLNSNDHFQMQPNLYWNALPATGITNGTALPLDPNILEYYNLTNPPGTQQDAPIIWNNDLRIDTREGTLRLTNPNHLQLDYTPQKTLRLQTEPSKSIPLQIDGSDQKPLRLQLDRSRSLPLTLNYTTTTPSLNLQYNRSNTLLYKVTETEEHATFTCPHCKKQSTILRRKPTSNSTQSRAASQNQWKFCPYCGKPVQ